jgi:hypothetical protein
MRVTGECTKTSRTLAWEQLYAHELLKKFHKTPPELVCASRTSLSDIYRPLLDPRGGRESGNGDSTNIPALTGCRGSSTSRNVSTPAFSSASARRCPPEARYSPIFRQPDEPRQKTYLTNSANDGHGIGNQERRWPQTCQDG